MSEPMSVDLNVSLDLDTDFDVDTFSGFLPCTYDGKPAGFATHSSMRVTSYVFAHLPAARALL